MGIFRALCFFDTACAWHGVGSRAISVGAIAGGRACLVLPIIDHHDTNVLDLGSVRLVYPPLVNFGRHVWVHPELFGFVDNIQSNETKRTNDRNEYTYAYGPAWMHGTCFPDTGQHQPQFFFNPLQASYIIDVTVATMFFVVRVVTFCLLL